MGMIFLSFSLFLFSPWFGEGFFFGVGVGVGGVGYMRSCVRAR